MTKAQGTKYLTVFSIAWKGSKGSFLAQLEGTGAKLANQNPVVHPQTMVGHR
jgi:hypothetical protein